MKTYDKKTDIALEMLDAAIVEYLDHQRYFAAFNLAGVAEELLGKFVRLEGGTDALTEFVELNKNVSDGLGQKPLSPKEWKRVIGSQKNSVKHMDSERERQYEGNIPNEAKRMIARAIKNYRKLGLPSRSKVKRFNDYRAGESQKLKFPQTTSETDENDEGGNAK